MAISIIGVIIIIAVVIGYFWFESNKNKLDKQVMSNKIDDKSKLKEQISKAKDKVEIIKLQKQLDKINKEIEELK